MSEYKDTSIYPQLVTITRGIMWRKNKSVKYLHQIQVKYCIICRWIIFIYIGGLFFFLNAPFMYFANVVLNAIDSVLCEKLFYFESTSGSVPSMTRVAWRRHIDPLSANSGLGSVWISGAGSAWRRDECLAWRTRTLSHRAAAQCWKPSF